MKDNKSDILYNFVIGGDGNYYEARGKNFEATYKTDFNLRENSIFVGFLGSFMENLPTQHITVLEKLIKLLISREVLSQVFTIIYENDLTYDQESLTKSALREFPNFYNCKFTFYDDTYGITS
jgi:hypothetical protein